MRYFVVVLALVAALGAAGCQNAPASPPDTTQVQLGEAFTLALGQDATVTGEALSLRFDQVSEDSRCPKQVECFWTGQARLTVGVQHDGRAPTPVEFNTNPAPGQNNQETTIGQYRIRLIALDPYPETPAGIHSDEYRAVLIVNRS